MKPINTWAISDLHFGHKRITEFRPFETMEEHEQCLMDGWCSVVNPRDKVWVLGDSAFSSEALVKLGSLPGTKFLVRGNHDHLPTWEYLKVFEEVFGLVYYKRKKGQKAWLSHAPIHPDELRGRINVHGHVHSKTISASWRVTGEYGGIDYHKLPDKRYVNVCPEAIGYAPVLLHPLIPKKETQDGF